jgi:hypothetical protein
MGMGGVGMAWAKRLGCPGFMCILRPGSGSRLSRITSTFNYSGYCQRDSVCLFTSATFDDGLVGSSRSS